MSRDPFAAFVDLINFDQKVYAAKKELKGLQAEVDKIEQEKRQIDSSIDDLQSRYKSSRMLVDAKELEMKSLDELEKDKKRKIETITSSKEYNSLMAEISRIKQKQHDLEPDLLSVCQDLENTKKNVEAAQQTADSKKNELVQAAQAKQQLIATLQAGIAQLEDERKSYLTDIPDEWLEKYSAMRERVSDPVVPVDRGSCSACFHSIAERDMILLRKHALVQCRGCYRFLYIPKDQSQGI